MSAFARVGRPFVYGHRGAPRKAPENTLRSFELGLAQGADGIELDVRTCASGEVIVLHDRDLGRVAGAAIVARATPFEQLRAVDLGGGERIPLLDDALELVLGAGALLNVELKASGEDPEVLVPLVVERVRLRPSAQRARVIFSSFSARVCARLQKELPEAEAALLFEQQRVEPAQGLRAVHPDHLLVDASAVASWKARQRLINVWTVNDAARARELSALGVDGLITDEVAEVLSALDASKPGPLS